MITRKQFLKSLLVVVALPLTTNLLFPTKESVSIPVEEAGNAFRGIKIKYLGKDVVKDCYDHPYPVYRYYLTMQANRGELYAFCDIDTDLCDISPNRALFIRQELSAMVEAMHMKAVS